MAGPFGAKAFDDNVNRFTPFPGLLRINITTDLGIRVCCHGRISKLIG
jgi:hypothetical protein